MWMNPEQRQAVTSALTVVVSGITALMIVLLASGMLEDAAPNDRSQTVPSYADQTAIPTLDTTPYAAWVEYAYATKRNFPPRPTKVAQCVVRLKSSYIAANIYQGANVHTNTIRVIKPREQYLFLGFASGWYCIEVPGSTGFIENRLVDLEC